MALNHGTQNCQGEVVDISRFMLTPNLRLKGHGTVVLRHLITLYQKAGAVRLKIPVSTTQGRRLYTKCGFATDFTNSELTLELQESLRGAIRVRPPRRVAAVSNPYCGRSDVPVEISASTRGRVGTASSANAAVPRLPSPTAGTAGILAASSTQSPPVSAAIQPMSMGPEVS